MSVHELEANMAPLGRVFVSDLFDHTHNFLEDSGERLAREVWRGAEIVFPGVKVCKVSKPPRRERYAAPGGLLCGA